MEQSQAVVTVHAEVREPWLNHLSPVEPLRTVWRSRELLWQLARREVIGRYRGSYLGVVWGLLTPLLTLAVFTLVFGTMHNNRWAGSNGGVLDFATNLFIGIIVFSIFSEVANNSARLVVGNPNFVKKAVFPLELLSVSTLLAAIVHALLAIVIQMGAVYLATGRIPWTAVLLPLLLIPTLLFGLGVSWLLAALGVFFRDLASAVPPLTQLLFFLTPIVYDRTLLSSFGWASKLLVFVNPFVFIVDAARGLVIRGELPNWIAYAYVCTYSAGVAMVGYIVFMRLRRYFADAL